MYKEKPFHILTKEEYIDIVVSQLEYLRPEMVIHRLTGDPKKEDLIVPLWAIHKIDVLNGVVRMLKKNKAYQGIDYKTNK